MILILKAAMINTKGRAHACVDVALKTLLYATVVSSISSIMKIKTIRITIHKVMMTMMLVQLNMTTTMHKQVQRICTEIIRLTY